MLGTGGTVVLVVVRYCLDAAQPMGKCELREDSEHNTIRGTSTLIRFVGHSRLRQIAVS